MSNPRCGVARVRSNVFRLLSGIALALAIVSAVPDRAMAGNRESADTAVDLFIRGASMTGLPITPEQGILVKQIVACALEGNDAGTCAKNIAVAVALEKAGAGPQVTSAAQCLVSGAPATTCLTSAVMNQLPEEVRPMATCVLSGQGDVPACTQKFVQGFIIDKVPADFRPAATCMVETQDPKRCGTQLAVKLIAENLSPNLRAQADNIAKCVSSSQNAASCISSTLPPELAPLGTFVGCIANNSNVQKCTADFANNSLPANTPPEARAMVSCIGEGANFGECVKRTGVTAGKDYAASQISPAAREQIEQALRMIERLKPDADLVPDVGMRAGDVATLKNIIMVAEGIKEGRWDKVVFGAGPELAKIASQVLLSIFLTPAIASALGPAVNAMIQNDAISAQAALQAMGRGDAVELAEVIFRWYATSFVDKPCALLGDNDVRNTLCGGLSDTIMFISNTAGDLAKEILGTGKDILEWLGVWGAIDNIATGAWNLLKSTVGDILGFFGIGGDDDEWKMPGDCRPAPEYFANNHLKCIGKAAAGIMSGAAGNMSALTQACTTEMNRCTHPDKRSGVPAACDAMNKSLYTIASQTADAVKITADFYTKAEATMAAVANEVYKNGNFIASDDMCAANFWQANENSYVTKCAALVNARFPLPDRAEAKLCAMPTPSRSAAQQACVDSLRNSTQKDKFAGPNSELCEKQKIRHALEQNRCQVTTRPVVVGIGGGKEITIQEPIEKCRDQIRPLNPGPKVQRPDWLVLRPSSPPVLTIPARLEKFPQLVMLGDGIDRDIIRIMLPTIRPGAATKGPSVLRPNPNAKATPSPSRPPVITRLPPAKNEPKGTGSGGWNGTNSKSGNRAMDVLGGVNTGNNLGGAAGNAGGPALGGFRPAPRTSSPAAAALPAKKGGGSGGPGMVDGRSGNSPVSGSKSGSTASKGGSSPAGGTKGAPAWPPLDYGGCSACTPENKDPVRVR